MGASARSRVGAPNCLRLRIMICLQIRRLVWALALAVVLVLPSCVAAKRGGVSSGFQGSGSDVAPALQESLQQSLNNSRRKSGSPGAQASVIWADGKRWSGSSGLADVDEGTAVSDETLFAMGSTTKSYAGALVLRLAEENVLSVSTSVEI